MQYLLFHEVFESFFTFYSTFFTKKPKALHPTIGTAPSYKEWNEKGLNLIYNGLLDAEEDEQYRCSSNDHLRKALPTVFQSQCHRA